MHFFFKKSFVRKLSLLEKNSTAVGKLDTRGSGSKSLINLTVACNILPVFKVLFESSPLHTSKNILKMVISLIFGHI